LPNRQPNDRNNTFMPKNPFEAVQVDFARFVVGCGTYTPLWCLLRECSLDSVQVHIAKCIARFWNTIRAEGTYHVSKHAARADLRLMIDGFRDCWSYKVCNFFAHMGLIDNAYRHFFTHARSVLHDRDAAFTYFWSLRLDAQTVASKLRQYWHDRVVNAVGNHCPRITTCFPRFSTYVHWSGVAATKYHPHMSMLIPPHKHRLLMLFRLGSWVCLHVHSGRLLSRRQRVARCNRTCTHCGTGQVEDELHVVFECTSYQGIRDQYSSLFTTDVVGVHNLHVFLNSSDQSVLADFLWDIYQQRISLNA
jgi:hypothetical protein